MTELSISLPLPPKELHPNGGQRHHPGKMSRLRNDYKELAWAYTLNVLDRRKLDDGDYRLTLRFYLEPRSASQQPDRDNLIAWMKHGLDGIAEAIGIDDRAFHPDRVHIETDKNAPRVVVTLQKLKESEAT